MPVYRRRSARQIAKLNAVSIDGYFGEGTRCFFIRGTILADTQVDGEYRTLAIARPGNLIEVEAFDGIWATVSITTRSGNRVGDNIRARMRLRESDLRTVGIDCAQILAGIGTYEQPMELEEPPHVEPERLPQPEPIAAAAAVAALAALAPWTETTSASTNGYANGLTNGHAAPAAAAVAEPVIAPTPIEPQPQPQPTIAPERTTPASEPFRIGSLFGGRTNIVDGKVFVEIGASLVAIALPVVFFFLRTLLSSKKNDRSDGP
jgi:hypothetical protein